MSDQAIESVAKEEQNAMKSTADENSKEIRKEAEELDEDIDEEVVKPRYKPERSLYSSILNSNDSVKKEAPK